MRRSPTYDTLMQMGRLFGFRSGYADLTRIYTTEELRQWFCDLAYVEYRLREDIQVYESQGLTPYQVGMRIWQHPTMQVTSRLKRKSSSTITISQSYSLALEQTFKFPFDRPEHLVSLCDDNLKVTQRFLADLGTSNGKYSDSRGPVWLNVSANHVLGYLESFQVDSAVRGLSLPLICAYIERVITEAELIDWTVAVRGRVSNDPRLGIADWGAQSGPVNQISRSRIRNTQSLGVVTGSGDE